MSGTATQQLVEWLIAELPAVLADIDRPARRAVELHEGWPGDIVQCDTVVLGDHIITQDEKDLGARHRNELVAINIEIITVRPGGTPAEAREGAYEIYEAINTRMRIYPSGLTLGGAACQAQMEPTNFLYGIKDKSRSGLLRCVLTAKTRI